MAECIFYTEEGVPGLELTTPEYVFPISVEQEGEDCIALFHMRAYNETELLALLADSAALFRTEGRSKMVVEPASRVAFLDFFDNHFVRLSGIEGDPTVEAQKSWLAQHQGLKYRVVQEGYAGAELPASSNGAVPTGRLRLSDIVDNKISIQWPLWSSAKERIETVTMLHHLRPETREDYKRYSAATSRVETHTRKKLYKVLMDNRQLTKLYDGMIEQLDGCVFQGGSCVANNKAEWCEKVPLWHKLAVVHEVFTGGVGRNF